ncbi:MAG: hypothetical protein OEU90_06005 [Gammaproteobacteria bacterium]|jgi:hypothetical protein|nr:hypothetical protein [Gammaproteobacteria bacterium]MDH3749571.1 hypothetical protein [Gammaproteobacteria bacterium]MDH3805012.1 hypothetical protein [Gammaproteobacteria bacterium]
MIRVAVLTGLIVTAVAVAAASPLDPLRVAPHIYELAFENEQVRVLKRIIRNGETPPLISQPNRVVVYLNPCAWMVDESDGSKRMESFKFGEPTWAPAETHGGNTSTVIQQCSVIEIELK